MRSAILLLSLALAGHAAAAAPQRLPAEFEHNRIHLVVHEGDGTVFKAYVDSGGGANMIGQADADRLKLAPAGTSVAFGDKSSLVRFPGWLVHAGVPAPPVNDPALHGHLLVQPALDMPDSQLFLGARWLDGRVWAIDYGRHEMIMGPDWKPGPADHVLPLAFQTDRSHHRTTHFPRITVTIDDTPLDMLLDTGAMVPLAAGGAAAFDLAPGTVVGGAFIKQAVFDAWHAKHPDWRVVDQGEATQRGPVNPMIEVPQVTLAGYTVGPVWFARRRDTNFDDFMSSMMDKPVVGAFGNASLQYFRLVLDYPRATAWVTPTKASATK